jgi:hypothetical protein
MTKADRLKTTRDFRRLRSQLKKDLGLKTPTRADRVLLDQASLLALRWRQMRNAILSGEQVSDEDLVRANNACIRAMAALRNRKDCEPQYETMREELLREAREREEAQKRKSLEG